MIRRAPVPPAGHMVTRLRCVLIAVLFKALFTLPATLLATLPATLLTTSAADADPAPHTHPACRAYLHDFPRQCRCSGADEYFTTYGLKYCNRFMHSGGFSPAGVRWREQVRSCLQQTIARRLDSQDGCDCARLRRFAFQSHVLCYTRHDPSICRLPPGDLFEILGLIDAADHILSAEGLAQALAIATICSAAAPQPSGPITHR